jgi:hypothetical protein
MTNIQVLCLTVILHLHSVYMSTALLKVLFMETTCIYTMNFTVLWFVDKELSCDTLTILHHAEYTTLPVITKNNITPNT